MRILFAGTPKNAVPTLQALIDSEHEIVGVLTRQPAPSGRGRKLVETDIDLKAKEHGITVFTPKTLKTPEIQEQLKELDIDLAVVVAYGNLIPKNVLEIPKHGWINLHFSILPRWRGAAPIQYALMNGDEKTGACVFQLEEGLDTGPVYTQLETEVGNKTSSELLEELGHSGAKIVLDAIEKIQNDFTPVPQPDEGVTLAPKIPSTLGMVDFTKDAVTIRNLIRAVTTQPGAYAFVDDKRIKIAPVEIVEEDDLRPGQILITKKHVFVGTATNNIKLGQVAPSGKSWMNACDWGRGVRGEKYFQTEES